MTKKWRGGIVGCGFFGGIQMEAWRRMEDVEIVAACDGQVDRARVFASRAYEDAVEMMASEELDFVDIATRPDTHLELVRLAVEKRVPAICQKPMARGMDEAWEMVRLVERSGVRVMMHENWRWQPWYRELKKLVDDGAVGTPITYAFRMRQRDGFGEKPYPNQPYFAEMPKLLMYETLIHPVDTARFLFGEIRAVMAYTRKYNARIAGEDRAVMVVEHGNGVDGVIDGHRFAYPSPRGPAMGDVVVEGEDGVVRVLANGAVLVGEREVSAAPVEVGYKGDSVLATQRHFLECLESGAPFETGVREYLGSFAAVEAAYQSVAEGRRIVLREQPPAAANIQLRKT